MLVSPNKVFTVIRDDKNRVMVVDNTSGSVIQAGIVKGSLSYIYHS